MMYDKGGLSMIKNLKPPKKLGKENKPVEKYPYRYIDGINNTYVCNLPLHYTIRASRIHQIDPSYIENRVLR